MLHFAVKLNCLVKAVLNVLRTSPLETSIKSIEKNGKNKYIVYKIHTDYHKKIIIMKHFSLN